MAQNASMEEFEALLNESFEIGTPSEGSVVKGTVIAIEAGHAIIDVGYKMEGRVELKEFAQPGDVPELLIGDEVEVFLDRVENARGEASISREKARREEAWDKLEKAHTEDGRVDGAIFGRVKGGFTVDLGGAVAFLPGSQVDVRPVRDAGPLMGLKQPFQILKMDRRRGNIVVSRRAILEESRAEQRAEIIANLSEGQASEGVVKNITEYGAFIDLGGVDGLLHVTDMAWRRISHPSEIVSIGDTIKVQVIKINKETHRISLGMKQLENDPWDTVHTKFPLESVHRGRVTNITDYGAFVELEPGIEGLVHISEMSWTKKNVHPGKIVSTSQEVDVMVLEIDDPKRRVSLGLKQTQRNPWEVFSETHPAGTPVEGQVKNITEFGLFVGLEGDIDGMVHLSDITWEGSGEEAIAEYRKGDSVRAVVTEVDVEKERISLSIKAANDNFAEAVDGVKRGAVITVEVTDIKDGGIEVDYEGARSFIRRADLSRDRAEQRTDRFQIGDKVDVRVTNVDSKSRRLSLSVKAREIAEEKEAVEQYGSSDAGASLGDILGAALGGSDDEKDEGKAKSAEKSKKAAAEGEMEADRGDATEGKAKSGGDAGEGAGDGGEDAGGEPKSRAKSKAKSGDGAGDGTGDGGEDAGDEPKSRAKSKAKSGDGAGDGTGDDGEDAGDEPKSRAKSKAKSGDGAGDGGEDAESKPKSRAKSKTKSGEEADAEGDA